MKKIIIFLSIALLTKTNSISAMNYDEITKTRVFTAGISFVITSFAFTAHAAGYCIFQNNQNTKLKATDPDYQKKMAVFKSKRHAEIKTFTSFAIATGLIGIGYIYLGL